MRIPQSRSVNEPSPETPYAVVYARVSSKDQEEGFSIDAQLDLLRGYAKRNSLKVLSEFIDVESAGNAGRTNFGHMLGFIRSAKHPVIILVEKTDRAYRNLKDYTTLDDLIREKDARIHLVKENEIIGRNATSHTKFIHGIKVLMAKNYVDNLSEEVRKGISQKLEIGQYPSNPPVGYLWNREKRSIVHDPVKAPLVKLMFERYATGLYSITTLSDLMTKDGLTSREGKMVSRKCVEVALKNPIYYGDFAWKGRLYKGRFEPIVTKDLWDRANKQLRRNNHPEQQRKHYFAFSGLLTCARCGSMITGEIKKGRYVYYRCANQLKCRLEYIREEELSRQLFEKIGAVEIGEEFAQWLKATADHLAGSEKAVDRQRQDETRKRVSDLKAKLDRLYTDHVERRIDDEFFQKKWNAWRAELTGAEQAAAQGPAASASGFKAFGSALELSKRAKSLYETAEPRRRAKLARIVLSNSTLDGVTLRGDYRKPFSMWAENGGRLFWRAVRDKVQTRLRQYATAV